MGPIIRLDLLKGEEAWCTMKEVIDDYHLHLIIPETHLCFCLKKIPLSDSLLLPLLGRLQFCCGLFLVQNKHLLTGL